ncbi:MAG: hypothetical protein JNM72_14700 [Deltaproteobacteria bacterium]|nr:hypothetical protein [Deltaproteobacteria bacterium]
MMLWVGLLWVQVASAGSLKDLDKRNGFRDVALTQRCDQIDGLKGNTGAVKAAVKDGLGQELSKEQAPYLGMLHYTRPSDGLEVGRARLLDVTYTCYMDQLMAVDLVAWGERNAEPLLGALVEAFGPATKADEETGVQRWVGKKVLLTYTFDKDTGFVRVAYASVPMIEAKRKNDEALEKAAVQDL